MDILMFIILMIGLLCGIPALLGLLFPGYMRYLLNDKQKQIVDDYFYEREEGAPNRSFAVLADVLSKTSGDELTEKIKNDSFTPEKSKPQPMPAVPKTLDELLPPTEFGPDELGPGEVWVLTDDAELVKGKIIEGRGE